MEASRAMLFHRKIPEKLWGEACATAVYILNRVINSNTGVKTPFKLYFRKKPQLNHLRVFGSLCFVKTAEKKRRGYQRMVEARSKKFVFAGYERDFSYKVYCPESNSIYLSREMIFDEKRYYNSESNYTYD